MVDEPVLRTAGLTVTVRTRRGNVPAVGPVDLAIAAGRMTVLLGESGSGKSLLALALGWLAPPGAALAGSVRFRGLELAAMDERARSAVRGRRIGFVLQEPETALDPLYTVGFQMREVLRVHHGLRRREADARSAEALRALEFGEPEAILGTFPHQLSGGQRQRILVALALLPGPELVVADEPTASLDPALRAAVLRRLERWRESHGASILLVTHDTGVARGLADDVVVLYAGEIVESGPARRVLGEPRHPYTRFLTGDAGALAAPELPPPAPGTWEPGCRLRPRCAHARPECAAAHPPLETAAGRRLRCPPAAAGRIGP